MTDRNGEGAASAATDSDAHSLPSLAGEPDGKANRPLPQSTQAPAQIQQAQASSAPHGERVIERRIFTDLYIRALKPSDKRYRVEDVLLPALKIRVHPSGQKRFIIHRRIKGCKNAAVLMLGSVEQISLAEARRKAREWLRLIYEGHDPRRVQKLQSQEQALASRIRAKLQSGIKPACYLYRHFDIDGDLLYVGVSLEPLNRQRQHRDGAQWYRSIYRIVLEPFAGREDALTAEALAIRTEFPKYNTTYNGARSPVQELARVISRDTSAGEIAP